MADRGIGGHAVLDTADAHHVAALLVIRVGVEQVVAHIFHDGLDLLALHVRQRGLRISDRHLIHQLLHGDDIARQQAGTPAEARREGRVSALHLHQRIADHLVVGAVKVATAVEQVFANGQFFRQLGLKRLADVVDQRLHLRVRRQQVGEHRQQTVLPAANLATLDIKIHHAQELAVGAGIGHQGHPSGVLHLDRLRHAIVGMAAEDGVDTGHPAGHLEVHIHAVVRQHHDHLRTLSPGLVDELLHALVTDTEGPIRHHPARVSDRGVGEGLADDGHLHAVDLLHHIGLEHLIAEVIGYHILGNELHTGPLEVTVDNFLHASRAISHLPVRRHHIHAQGDTGIDHVLRVRPQRGSRTLPGITPVHQQGAGAGRTHLVHQRLQVRKTAHLAVGTRRRLEIDIRERMRVHAARLDVIGLKQVLADEVRHLADRATDAQVDIRLAEIDRLQLRVAVGHMHQRHIAKGRHVVIICGGLAGQRLAAIQDQAAGRGRRQDLQKFTTIHGCIPYRRLNGFSGRMPNKQATRLMRSAENTGDGCSPPRKKAALV